MRIHYLSPHMVRLRVFCLTGLLLATLALAEPKVGNDADARADARAMVERMGGLAIWRDLESVHFVHEWDFVNRPDRYLEHEILDLTGPRSYVTMDSEIRHRTRAYSPEHGHWSVTDGAFEIGSDEVLARSVERAPFSLYRIARFIARDTMQVRYGTLESHAAVPALEFLNADGSPGGWIILNSRKEPVIWATTNYVYVMGPLKRFGNLLVSDWATTNNGLVRYQMVSLTGSNQRPDLALFARPEEHRQ